MHLIKDRQTRKYYFVNNGIGKPDSGIERKSDAMRAVRELRRKYNIKTIISCSE